MWKIRIVKIITHVAFKINIYRQKLSGNNHLIHVIFGNRVPISTNTGQHTKLATNNTGISPYIHPDCLISTLSIKAYTTVAKTILRHVTIPNHGRPVNPTKKTGTEMVQKAA